MERILSSYKLVLPCIRREETYAFFSSRKKITSPYKWISPFYEFTLHILFLDKLFSNWILRIKHWKDNICQSGHIKCTGLGTWSCNSTPIHILNCLPLDTCPFYCNFSFPHLSAYKSLFSFFFSTMPHFKLNHFSYLLLFFSQIYFFTNSSGCHTKHFYLHHFTFSFVLFLFLSLSLCSCLVLAGSMLGEGSFVHPGRPGILFLSPAGLLCLIALLPHTFNYYL